MQETEGKIKGKRGRKGNGKPRVALLDDDGQPEQVILPGGPAAYRDPNDPGTIRIMRPKWRLLQVELESLAPMLMGKMPDDEAERIGAKESGVQVGRRAPKDPIRCMEGVTHKDTDGDYALPAAALIQSFCSVAHKDKGLPKTVVERALRIPASMIKLKTTKPIMHKCIGFIGGRGTGKGGRGGATMLYRPLFEKWSCTVPVRFNQDLISLEEVVNLIDCAGSECGIGPWRPGLGKGGQFGLYAVKR